MRAGREPDRVHEEREAEGLHEAEALAEAGVDRAERQPDEERTRGAEPHRAERHGPERRPERDDEEDRQQRGRRQHVQHPLHRPLPPRPQSP